MPKLTHLTRDHRRARLDAVMARHGLDALILSTPDYVEFATNHGLTVQGWERPFAVVLLAGGAAFGIFPDISGNKLRDQQDRGDLWLESWSQYSEIPRLEGRRRLTPHFPDLLAERLAEAGLGRARIGLDAASSPVSRAIAALPEAKPVPLGPALREARLIKHAEEVAAMRAAAALTDVAIGRYREEIRPGRILGELDHMVAAQVMAAAAEAVPGEDFQITRFMTLSGADSAAPHGSGAGTGARVLPDAVATVICNVRLNGLGIENQRSFLVGRVGAEAARAADTARAATEAGLAAAAAGRALSGVDEAAQAVIERAGYGAHLLHRTGHGIGVATHEFPEDMAFNPRPLLAGEVIVVEPGIYIRGLGGFRYVDVQPIGDPAPPTLTTAPRDRAAMTIG
jgi:Xaa-Pro aminopeptidase